MIAGTHIILGMNQRFLVESEEHMKKRSRVIVISLCVLLSAGIVFGVIGFFGNQDHTKGNFFRKMYGSVATLSNQESIQMQLFNFGENVDFLEDWKNLSFDNSAVEITDLSYKKQMQENNLTVYDVSVKVNLQGYGKHIIKSLHYSGQSKDGKQENKDFSLGELYFLYENKDELDDFSDYVKEYGNYSAFNDNKATFSFKLYDKKSFTIAGIITPDCDSISYQYKKNTQVNSGKTFDYDITVNDKAGKFDYRIFQPIFEFKFPNKQNAEYLSVMRVQDGDAMSYDEIKEYVK